MSWKIDKRWSDKFIPNIKPILGTHFIAEPPIEEDRDRNTDLIVLNMDSIRFGCRIRKYKDYAIYGHQFTIRASRPSGVKTEIHKIAEGWGDYFFYGFSNKEETDLEDWFIGDLKIFRRFLHERLKVGFKDWNVKYNPDNSSKFLVFDKKDLPEEFIKVRVKGKKEPATLKEGLELVWDMDKSEFRIFNWTTTQGDVNEDEVEGFFRSNTK